MSLTFSYNSPNQGEATVTGHTDRDNVAIVVIPSTVVNDGTTYNVTSIGNSAFPYCSALESVTIGNRVTSIGNEAFYYCSALQSVTIGNSVQTIGDNAFASCSALPNLAIGDSVTSIGNNAFYYCSALDTIILTINNKLGYTETTNNVSFYGATVTVKVIIQFDLDNVSGYMNVFDLNNDGTKGGYKFGDAWGVPALQYTETDGLIKMKPNVNTYNNNPESIYWRNNNGAGPDGNKFMEASAFNNSDSLSALPNKKFSCYVEDYTLDDRYTFEMYALLFSSDYGIISEKSVDINVPGTYNLILDDSFDNDNGFLLQYGFRMKGINANPDTDWGSVKFYNTLNTSNTPPQFDSDAPTTATEDVSYTYTPQVSDPDGDSLTITADTLPGWLTFDGTTLSGTPTQAVLDADGTSHPVKLVVSDGTASVEQEFTITITPVNDAPFFTSNPVTTASEDVLYTYTPVVNDVDSTSLTIADPVLPAWLTFENGVLSGTPSLNDDRVTNIELTVSDGELSTKQLFIITLNYNVKTIAQAEYNKKPASGLGDSGNGFDFSVKHLIVTASTSTYDPTWYGAETVVVTDKVVEYEDGKVLVRDSRLDNANDSQIQQIAAEWAIKNNHYNFHYDASNKIIFINESVGSNYMLLPSTIYKTGYLNKKREEVFGDRVILKNRYAVDFVGGEETIHEIDTQKILNTSGGLELSVVENSLPEWLIFKDGNEDDEDEHVSGTYKLIGTPIGLENVKTYQVEINVKDGEETNKLTINVKVGLYNDDLLENVDLDNLKRDYERELL